MECFLAGSQAGLGFEVFPVRVIEIYTEELNACTLH